MLVTAFNEEAVIAKRIRNIMDCDYPGELLEVLVASDGSTDRTDDIAKGFNDPRVVLFRPERRLGKTETQNEAVEKAKGEIILFTDADTIFEKDFLRHIVNPFYDDKVGLVTGQLALKVDEDSGISKGHARYWSSEMKIREMEDRLGILAVSTGACMAVRKSLFKKLDGNYGEDCIVPLDIVLQGYHVVYKDRAVAFDIMPQQLQDEFKTRVRMTLRNWQGTWSRAQLLNPFKYTGYAFSLWSHKILRWLSPVFLIMMTLSSFALYDISLPYKLFSLSLVILYSAGIVGMIIDIKGFSVPGISTAYGFLVANVGFLLGIIKSICGHRIVNYRE